MKNMLTINELSAKTGISRYEIRRRVHNGTVPHMRVGAKQSKILIDSEIFDKLLTEESINNITSIKSNNIKNNDSTDGIGYDRLRKID